MSTLEIWKISEDVSDSSYETNVCLFEKLIQDLIKFWDLHFSVINVTKYNWKTHQGYSTGKGFFTDNRNSRKKNYAALKFTFDFIIMPFTFVNRLKSYSAYL